MATVAYSNTYVQVDCAVLFVPGGDVHRHYNTQRRQLERAARSFAPPRQSSARWGTWARGALQASIYSEIFSYAANDSLGIEFGARVPYAEYVHEGTAKNGTQYIYTARGWANRGVVTGWIRNRQFNATSDEAGMYMPITRIPFKTRYVLRVRGQSRNPFLVNALYLVSRNPGSGLPSGRRRPLFMS